MRKMLNRIVCQLWGHYHGNVMFMVSDNLKSHPEIKEWYSHCMKCGARIDYPHD